MGQLMKFTAVIIKEGPYHSPPPYTRTQTKQQQ